MLIEVSYPFGVWQAVHSGADLQAAAASVLGYQQPSVKGKAILVEPVPNVATPEFSELLHDALSAQQRQVRQLAAIWHTCIHRAISMSIFAATNNVLRIQSEIQFRVRSEYMGVMLSCSTSGIKQAGG